MNHKQLTPRQRIIHLVTQQICGQRDLGLSAIARLMDEVIAADSELQAYWAQASGGARRKVKSLIKQEVEMTRLVVRQDKGAGKTGPEVSAPQILANYQTQKTGHTLRRQRADLRLFARYLSETGTPLPSSDSLVNDLHTWWDVTWMAVTGFVAWQAAQGYAINSINSRLSTIRSYCRLAAQAGVISPVELALIKEVASFNAEEGRMVDQARDTVRLGQKKQAIVKLTSDQVEQLKDQPDTWQGWRDKVLICLMVDLGLRASEISGLQAENVNPETGKLTFFRSSVEETQQHSLSADTQEVLGCYGLPQAGPLLWSSLKGGQKATPGMSVRSINKRIGVLGAQIEIEGLSPHDLRRYWIAQRADQPAQLIQAGGWRSLATVMRYVQSA